jgi:hypothetical protein
MLPVLTRRKWTRLWRNGSKERPIRLLDPPEWIDVTLAEVPEGPPGRFRWRHASYRVASAEGPERIAPEWWRESLPAVEKKEQEENKDYERRRKQATVEENAPFDPRLFPHRRIATGRPLLGFIGRAFTACRKSRRAGICRGFSHERAAAPQPGWSSRSISSSACSRIFPSCVVDRKSGGIGGCSLSGTGACRHGDWPTAIQLPGVGARLEPVEIHSYRERNPDGNPVGPSHLPYHPGCRLVFDDGTPDMLAYPQGSHRAGDISAACLLRPICAKRPKKGATLLRQGDLLEWGDRMSLAVLADIAADEDRTLTLLRALKHRFGVNIRLAVAPQYRGEGPVPV